MPRLSWLIKVVRNSYLCPPAARGYHIKLQRQGYTARRTTDNIYHEKSQLNRLVWGTRLPQLNAHFVHSKPKQQGLTTVPLQQLCGGFPYDYD